MVVNDNRKNHLDQLFLKFSKQMIFYDRNELAREIFFFPLHELWRLILFIFNRTSNVIIYATDSNFIWLKGRRIYCQNSLLAN